MKGFVLTKEQLSALKEAHRKAKRSNALATYKINAVVDKTLVLMESAHTLPYGRSIFMITGMIGF